MRTRFCPLARALDTIQLGALGGLPNGRHGLARERTRMLDESNGPDPGSRSTECRESGVTYSPVLAQQQGRARRA